MDEPGFGGWHGNGSYFPARTKEPPSTALCRFLQGCLWRPLDVSSSRSRPRLSQRHSSPFAAYGTPNSGVARLFYVAIVLFAVARFSNAELDRRRSLPAKMRSGRCPISASAHRYAEPAPVRGHDHPHARNVYELHALRRRLLRRSRAHRRRVKTIADRLLRSVAGETGHAEVARTPENEFAILFPGAVGGTSIASRLERLLERAAHAVSVARAAHPTEGGTRSRCDAPRRNGCPSAACCGAPESRRAAAY